MQPQIMATHGKNDGLDRYQLFLMNLAIEDLYGGSRIH
jgi:hypothetical protein